MMTTTVNTFAFSNLSLICRNGTEAVGRLSQIPYITTTSAPRAVTPVRRQQKPKKAATPPAIRSSSTGSKKRLRTKSVRFAPEITEQFQEGEPQRTSTRPTKRRRFEASDSACWWSQGELKDIQRSCVVALRSQAAGLITPEADNVLDMVSLDKFSPASQTKRRLARSKSYETIKAVQAFEKATNTKADPEMLSMLLQRHSVSRVIEANAKALVAAQSC